MVRHLKRKLNLNANNKEVACGGPVPDGNNVIQFENLVISKVIELKFDGARLAA